jgi:hypothetical protein
MVPDNVQYLDVTIQRVQDSLVELQGLVQAKVLPQSRYAFTKRIQAAHTLLEQTQELLDRSGMGKRLGFVPTDQGTQCVMMHRPEGVKALDEVESEGAGLPDGDAGGEDSASPGAT